LRIGAEYLKLVDCSGISLLPIPQA